MGALTHLLTEKSRGTAPAILFDNVPGYPSGYRTLYGQLSRGKRRYKVAVSDRSSTNGFVLQKLQHRAVSVTAPTFVGTHSVSITLTAGRWLVMPRLGKATYSIVVG